MQRIYSVILYILIGFAAFAMPSSPGRAAVILDIDSGTGKLLGARNVDVSGTLYNVRFLDGACADLFSGCDQTSDFDFATTAEARDAAQALLDQVFIDSIFGGFDSAPSLTFGCGWPGDCDSFIPTGLTDRYVDGSLLAYPAIVGGVAINYVSGSDQDAATTFFSTGGLYFHTNSTSWNFARFTLSQAAVPEPGGAGLFLVAGLALLVIRGCQIKA